MKETSSYAVEIRGINKQLRGTVKIYQDALSYCVKLYDKEWDRLENEDGFTQKRIGEQLIHNTKNNKAICDFDERFYKMPTYLRRAVNANAIGQLSSYNSNLDNWYNDGCKGNKPILQTRLNKMPVFYKGGMYDDCPKGEYGKVKLKLYIDNDWKWVDIRLKKTDLRYIQRHCNMEHMSSPTLERRNKKWFLRFSFDEDIQLKKKKAIKEQKILAIDLGINTDAVCSVMKSDGTILNRKFINFVSDKDYLKHTLNKIKKVQQKYGSHNIKKLWRIARFRNEELARKIAKKIVEYANEQDCDVIVMEYLDFKGKKKGNKKQRLHMWKVRSIQTKIEQKAHKKGIRISRVCAVNSSKLAYDGSGEVLRGKKGGYATEKLCRFSNGREYNSDLNASYNIGARYYIREIKKSISAKKWSDIQAQVPGCEKRSRCTLNSLRGIDSYMYA